jgi:Cas3, HD domain
VSPALRGVKGKTGGSRTSPALRSAHAYKMTRGMAIIRSGNTDASPWDTWRDLTAFWGKARPPADRPSPSYHPLVFHSLDVAAVGQVVLARWPGLSVRLAAALGLEIEAATALLTRLLALHDLGKFACRFQAKSPAHYDPTFGSIQHASLVVKAFA